MAASGGADVRAEIEGAVDPEDLAGIHEFSGTVFVSVPLGRERIADDLVARYGDAVRVDVGGISWPLDEADPMFSACADPLPAGDAVAGLSAEVTPTHDEVAVGENVTGTVVLTNATDGPGRERLWALRERHTEAISSEGIPHKLDVSVPLDRMAEFEARVRSAVAAVLPEGRTILFGHLGDGNIHVNVLGADLDDGRVDDAVLQLVAELGGSISAEHGIGVAKIPWLELTRSAADIAAMRAIKAALDPKGILNPGVIFPLE